ncbi:hypothetical protein PHLGIDRAFT_247900 [Phlebiopsis gigantea 11061_1 CR5-6]|uniref:Uncharacterized protein n=1 Tax=Phlebiopsis gigantea (strain 11061_1 CR5-6) TaxID=745531 RepID=A0A0C3PSD2_PHLG1|nr:hypothetical protein PHLGIDRAFT_247900 [Phlebiopsis gigantea 11061_1 CR5-6]
MFISSACPLLCMIALDNHSEDGAPANSQSVGTGGSIIVTFTATSLKADTVTTNNNSSGESVSSTVIFYGDSTIHTAGWQTITWAGRGGEDASAGVAPSSGYTDLDQSGKILSVDFWLFDDDHSYATFLLYMGTESFAKTQGFKILDIIVIAELTAREICCECSL